MAESTNGRAQNRDECVILFERTHELMAAEHCLQKNGLPPRIMPVPAAIRRGCGLALRLYPEELAAALRALAAEHLPCLSLYRRRQNAGKSHYEPWEET